MISPIEQDLQDKWDQNLILDLDKYSSITFAEKIHAWDEDNTIQISLEDPTSKQQVAELVYQLFTEDPYFPYYRAIDFENALSEIENLLTNEEFSSVLQVVTITMQMIAAYKFETIDLYLQKGEYPSRKRNIFNPARMIALGCYLAELTEQDYIDRANLLELKAQKESFKNQVFAQIARAHFKPNGLRKNDLELRILDDVRFQSIYPMIKPDWTRITAFLSVTNINGEPIKSKQWLNLNYKDFLQYQEQLEAIYPDINVYHLISAIQKLSEPSSFEKF